MSENEEIVVINEGLETRTSASGKQRFTIRIEAEPVVHNFNKETMGGPVAEAIANHYRARIKGISAVASPSTLLKRKYEETAFNAGKPWAMKKFSGGRMGPMAPNQSDRLFNNSTRFWKSIVANASKDGAWRINVAANRLSGDAATVERIWQRLIQLVPEFAQPALLLQSDTVRAGMQKAHDGIMKKMGKTTGKLQFAVVKALFQTAKNIAGLAGD